RFDSEVIRDASLAVAGLLNLKAGGPSVLPELRERMTPPRGGWEDLRWDGAQPAQRVHLRKAQCSLPDDGSFRYAGYARIVLAPRSDHHGAPGPYHDERWRRAGLGAGILRLRTRGKGSGGPCLSPGLLAAAGERVRPETT